MLRLKLLFALDIIFSNKLTSYFDSSAVKVIKSKFDIARPSSIGFGFIVTRIQVRSATRFKD